MNKGIKAAAAALFFLLPLGVFAQSYLGIVTQASNLRAGPGTEHEVIAVLAEGTLLFVDSGDGKHNFYNVIDIANGTEGWIAKSLVILREKLPENPQGKMFTPSGKTLNVLSEVLIQNQTAKVLSLVLNEKKYTFKPGEEISLELPAGSYRYRASAPGVLPSSGTEEFASFSGYRWTFFIESVF
ncbi:MAG: SH3 domain-containing protein [Spirochaetaceae bacterium]|jgi:SH3-like domain-containing protein|nr:SH3 domain-containing protein [Spirochaetaceae bacterium]